MKHVLTLATVLAILLQTGCSLFDSSDSEVADGDFQLVNDGEVILSLSKVEFYDFSSNILYLQLGSDLELIKDQIGGSAVQIKQQPIYSILDHSHLSSFFPQDPFVYRDFGMFGDFAFQINYMGLSKVDPRKDPRIIRTLQDAGKYRAGIKSEIVDISPATGNRLLFTIKLTNTDPENYYYLDPNKMGMPLFNYFSNGPYFYDESNQQYRYHSLSAAQPEPFDSWNIDWMSKLGRNQTRTLFLEYSYKELPKGKTADIHFSFPGLSFFHIRDRNELLRKDGRIWLGEAVTQKNFRFR